MDLPAQDQTGPEPKARHEPARSARGRKPPRRNMDPQLPLIAPDPDDPRLSSTVVGIDQAGAPVETRVVTERPLTLYLNGQEIVTMMTIGDHPDLLAVGYLKNQNMLEPDNPVIGIDYDD